MKTLIAAVAAGALTAGATFFYVANQKTSAFLEEKKAMETAWAAEKSRLEEDVRTAKRKSPQIQVQEVTKTVEVPSGAPGGSAEEIINELIELKPVFGQDFGRTRRRIIHEFESLNDLGVTALPAIQNFLSLNQDVEYERPEPPQEEQQANAAQGGNVTPQGQGGRGGRGGPGGGFDRQAMEDRFRSARVRLPDSDFEYPPSLRLGLMEVAMTIGGEAAESILVSVLQTSARSIEVAYAVRVLDEMYPNKYRELAVSAAKELLLNPIEMPDPSRYDRYGKTYLYAILDHYNDASFAADAQRLLIGADGNLDQTTLTYLNDILGENVVPTLASAYMDPRLTNGFDKARLIGMATPYFGTNPQANQMFTTLMKDPESDARSKFMVLTSLDGGGGFGRDRNEAPTDPATIQARMSLLEQALPYLGEDERMLGMAERTYENLQKLSVGEPIESGFGGRDRGGRGGPPGGFGGGGDRGGRGGR